MMILLLVGLLVALAAMNLSDLRAWKAFKQVEDSRLRRRTLRLWTLTSFIAFGVGTVVILALLGRTEALLALPVELAVLAPRMVARQAISGDYMLGMGLGATIGLAFAGVVWFWRLRKAGQPMLGDVQPLMPRNGRELLTAIPLAINAGVSEELFFRLLLPLVAAQATGSAVWGFIIAGAAFGLMHWYQGWKGVLAVTLMGGVFTWLYLSTGSLLKPIISHIVIDLIALVLRPAIGLWIARRRSASNQAAAPV